MSKTYMLITFINNSNKNYFNKIKKDTPNLQNISHKSLTKLPICDILIL